MITAAIDRSTHYGEGSKEFLLRRAAKLVPLYLVFLHLNIAFFLIASALTRQPEFFRNSVSRDNLTLYNYILHLTFAQGFTPSKINSLLDGSWSIVCEMYFYITISFIFKRFINRINLIIWTLSASLLANILFSLLISRYLGAFGYYAFPVQLPCFIIGILTYRIRATFPAAVTRNWQIATAVTMLLLFVGFTRLDGAPLGGHIAMSLMFAVALITLRITSVNGNFGMLQIIGRQSYALFLVHILLLKIYYTCAQVNHFEPGFWPTLFINLMISIPVSFIASYLLFDPIDRFFVNRMKKYLSTRRKGIAHSA